MKHAYRANKRALTCEKIRRYIEDNDLKAGSRLPSQRQMCSLFGVSRQCIQDAVEILEKEGVLRARPRSGLYVSAYPFEVLAASVSSNLRRHQYANFIRISTKTLSQKQIWPDEELQRLMRIPGTTPVMELKRVRCREGTAICLEYSYTPLDLFPQFLQMDFTRASIRGQFLEADCDPFVSGSSICITRALPEEAALLGGADQLAVSAGTVTARRYGRVIEYYCNFSLPGAIFYTHTAGQGAGGFG